MWYGFLALVICVSVGVSLGLLLRKLFVPKPQGVSGGYTRSQQISTTCPYCRNTRIVFPNMYEGNVIYCPECMRHYADHGSPTEAQKTQINREKLACQQVQSLPNLNIIFLAVLNAVQQNSDRGAIIFEATEAYMYEYSFHNNKMSKHKVVIAQYDPLYGDVGRQALAILCKNYAQANDERSTTKEWSLGDFSFSWNPL